MAYVVSYEKENFWQRASAFLLSWGWVISFVGVSFFSYAHASKKKIESYVELSQRLQELTRMKEEALSLQQELQLEIQSQSDPKWIELTLMKGLGLVPEGKKKVFFQQARIE